MATGGIGAPGAVASLCAVKSSLARTSRLAVPAAARASSASSGSVTFAARSVNPSTHER
jgi:hypothetical protein